MNTLNDLPVSVVIMTFNEEVNLQACLESVAGYAREICIVDSFSTDRTLEIARRFTDKIYQHAYEGAPQQWKWALDSVPLQHQWLFAVDADFRVTPELWRAIADAISRGGLDIDGYYVRHKQIFRGRFIKHGTIYPRYWLRLFKRDRVMIDPNDLVDQHFHVPGKVARLEYDVVEDNAKERRMRFWIEKQLKFADWQAEEELRRSRQEKQAVLQPALFGHPDQRTLWLKRRWFALPLYIRSFVYFFYRYFLRLGFLDGKEGFLYHFSQALLYRLLVDIRLEELRAEAKTLETRRRSAREDSDTELADGVTMQEPSLQESAAVQRSSL